MIFYFSGTGNSRHIAGRLAGSSRLAQPGIEERLIDMAAEMKRMKLRYPVREHERIGFVFPVYFYGVPKIVEDFVRDFELPGLGPTNYVYAVMTCGGSTGNAGKMLAKLLGEQDYNLSAQYAVQMVNNYVPLYKIVSRKEQEEILAQAERETDQIIEAIAKVRLKDANYRKGVFPALTTLSVYPFYRYGRKTSKFSAGRECSGCRLCERECPYGAITAGEDGRPVWEKERCILCLKCLHQCPQGAVTYGKRSGKNGRYIYPGKA